MKISEKVIIVARSAGGKDYLASYLKSKGLKKSVMHTTRPIRDKEVNGETYHFITDDKFKQMIDSDEFYEWDNFIGWYYGSTKQDFIDNDVFLKTPKGISKISKEDRENCFVIFLDMPENILLERLKKRNDSNDSIERRMSTDREDFKDFNDYDLKITDAEYDPEFILSLIK